MFESLLRAPWYMLVPLLFVALLVVRLALVMRTICREYDRILKIKPEVAMLADDPRRYPRVKGWMWKKDPEWAVGNEEVTQAYRAIRKAMLVWPCQLFPLMVVIIIVCGFASEAKKKQRSSSPETPVQGAVDRESPSE